LQFCTRVRRNESLIVIPKDGVKMLPKKAFKFR